MSVTVLLSGVDELKRSRSLDIAGCFTWNTALSIFVFVTYRDDIAAERQDPWQFCSHYSQEVKV